VSKAASNIDGCFRCLFVEIALILYVEIALNCYVRALPVNNTSFHQPIILYLVLCLERRRVENVTNNHNLLLACIIFESNLTKCCRRSGRKRGRRIVVETSITVQAILSSCARLGNQKEDEIWWNLDGKWPGSAAGNMAPSLLSAYVSFIQDTALMFNYDFRVCSM
jgi:hypothetical protein